MNIYFSNLSAEATREDLLKAFQAHGEVSSITVPANHMSDGVASGINRGYGFVVMPDKSQALAALAALDRREFRGRALSVQVARPARLARRRR